MTGENRSSSAFVSFFPSFGNHLSRKAHLSFSPLQTRQQAGRRLLPAGGGDSADGRVWRAAARGSGGGRLRGGDGARVRAPPPRHQRAARARVYVPRGAADVSSRMVTLWRYRSAEFRRRIHPSGSSGRLRRGGEAGRSARTNDGDVHTAGPDLLPTCLAPRDPRLTSRALQSQHRGLALEAAGAGVRRCCSTGIVNRSGRT